jgi:hypothetical protein
MRRWLVLFVAAVALAALVAAGCGGSSSSSTSTPASSSGGAAGLTAQQIVDKSNAAMQSVKSAAFALDLTASIKGDASKVTDSTTKALLKSPITVNAKGSFSNEPQKADMTLTAAIAGQTLDVGLKMDTGKVWIDFMNQWYVIDQSMLSGLTGSSPAPSATSGALTQQLQDQIKALGIDPTKWSEGYTLAGTETLDGAEVYHVQQAINVDQLVNDILKLSSTASSLGIGGASPSPGTEEQLQKVAQGFKDALKGLKIDYYYEKGNYHLRKVAAAATMDFSGNADAAAQGLKSISFNFGLTLSNFDEPVTVEPPSSAKPFQDLLQALMGSSGSIGL